MFSIEAILTVPLSMTIFIQGILFVKPLQFRMEEQTKLIAEERVAKNKNQSLYGISIGNNITKLEVNPQKMQEIISLAYDMQRTILASQDE